MTDSSATGRMVRLGCQRRGLREGASAGVRTDGCKQACFDIVHGVETYKNRVNIPLKKV